MGRTLFIFLINILWDRVADCVQVTLPGFHSGAAAPTERKGPVIVSYGNLKYYYLYFEERT